MGSSISQWKRNSSLDSLCSLPCHATISTEQKKDHQKKLKSLKLTTISHHPNQLTTKPYTIPTAGHHYHNSTIATKLVASCMQHCTIDFRLSSICSFAIFYMDQVTSTSLSVLSQVSCWNQRLSVRVALTQVTRRVNVCMCLLHCMFFYPMWVYWYKFGNPLDSRFRASSSPQFTTQTKT